MVVPTKVFLHVLNTSGMVKFDIDGRVKPEAEGQH